MREDFSTLSIEELKAKVLKQPGWSQEKLSSAMNQAADEADAHGNTESDPYVYTEAEKALLLECLHG